MLALNTVENNKKNQNSACFHQTVDLLRVDVHSWKMDQKY